MLTFSIEVGGKGSSARDRSVFSSPEIRRYIHFLIKKNQSIFWTSLSIVTNYFKPEFSRIQANIPPICLREGGFSTQNRYNRKTGVESAPQVVRHIF
jgi:hypothetical protein